MGYECANCGADISHKPPWIYWCNRCYHDFKEDILNKTEWTRYLVNLEASRRGKEKRRWEAGYREVYLGENDLAMIQNTPQIIRNYKEEAS